MDDHVEALDPRPHPPLVLLLLIPLLIGALLAERYGEPYPSVQMPGFHFAPVIVQRHAIPTVVVQFGEPSRETLDETELFPDVPPGQRARMVQRLVDLSGTPAEWAWIDSLADRRASVRPAWFEVVELRPGRAPETLLRVERESP